MRAYLVRLIKTSNLVGIFFANDRAQLQSLVGECTDIDACEYAPLRAGGIMWTSDAVKIPTELGDSFPWQGAALTDSWDMSVNYEVPRWQDLYQEGDHFRELEIDRAMRAVDQPEPSPPARPRLHLVK
jgi:hypothetical protein